jgi:hypothetical protein
LAEEIGLTDLAERVVDIDDRSLDICGSDDRERIDRPKHRPQIEHVAGVTAVRCAWVASGVPCFDAIPSDFIEMHH